MSALQAWLDEQLQAERALLLMIDTLAEPNPLPALFAADAVQQYSNLYQNTELADMAEMAPWLVHITAADNLAVAELLSNPDQQWGWLASVDSLDFAAQTAHWQARLWAGRAPQPALYRFQDGRVLARHLSALAVEQRPLLLGSLASVLCWHDYDWRAFANPHAKACPAPFATPWLNVPEPREVSQAIRLHNAQQWLWQTYPHATANLAETEPLAPWLAEQLKRFDQWGWQTAEQLAFYLAGHLDSALAADTAWLPQSSETAEQHWQRCQQRLAQIISQRVSA
ncbi:DUF4123 domain-containing protein [Atopomonas sediminilitoris]|uniref:DUF4123 domain-containing protein n=1 Tax=Atopomonas sediminilitoris TaxID=2919919 RepID=UPI001F4E78B2|nr:DUF4123 domain-containing protein [Atopomonas sediminilitoris]MCJ8170450.1 DUF4123 domain-containing protein [Atopomonas sediminilitoris]